MEKEEEEEAAAAAEELTVTGMTRRIPRRMTRRMNFILERFPGADVDGWNSMTWTWR